MCFNILVGRFYYTNNAATNIIDHNGFDAILHTLSDERGFAQLCSRRHIVTKCEGPICTI
jgi:hypothetical protein